MHDSALDDVDARRAAHAGLVAELRRLIEASVVLDAPVAVLEGLRAGVAELSGVATQHAHETGKAFPRFGAFEPGDTNAVLPYSPVSGALNPLAPPVHMRVEGQRLVGEVRFGQAHEGPPRCAHGSIVALVYDQLLALANAIASAAGPTAWLTVRYLQPTPLFEELRFEAWTDRVEGGKVWSRGRCLAGERVVTEAEGLFIPLDADRAARVFGARGREDPVPEGPVPKDSVPT